MLLYLVRHAEAVECDPEAGDDVRHLTGKGRRVAAETGSTLNRMKVRPEIIISSPLVRAVQTAEIIAGSLKGEREFTVSSLLVPGVSPEEFTKTIRESGFRSVMIVGHEPSLGSLAALLMGTDREIRFGKGACLALQVKKSRIGSARFQWYMMKGRKLVDRFGKAFGKKPDE